MIFTWLRQHLGLLQGENNNEIWRTELSIRYTNLSKQLDRIEKAIAVSNSGVARIIAKLDPLFGASEFDTGRREASDKLGQDIIRRLEAEDWARRHAEGKD